ncbi:sphingosine kinase 1 [Ctenodactylus gundi]
MHAVAACPLAHGPRSALATARNEAGASRAPAPGGEGEPHNQPRAALLGSTDKECMSGPAAMAGSAPAAPAPSWPQGPRDQPVDPAGGFSPGRGVGGAGPRRTSPPARGRFLRSGSVESVTLAFGSRRSLPRPCRALVLLNPRSGKGKALQQFQTLVRPLLTEAQISFKLMVTERQNHARELVKAEELDRWDALVIMSGDGLIHEVVNGLMDKPDWETAIRKPLCCLPGGSGNALAASLNHYAGFEQVTGEDLLTNCTRLLCRRLLSPMNLLSLHTASGTRVFSVLSLAWGFVADVDIESEKYRCLGEMRFTVGTLFRLANLRISRGRLAYLPVGSVTASNTTPAAAPGPSQQGPTDTYLVPLGEPVPSHWTVVPEQDFVLVLALLHTHMGSKMFTAPMGRSAAGAVHLFYVRAGASRATLLRLFLAMEKGKHMDSDCPHLVHVPVAAFRLEVKDGRGVFAVDGELLVTEAVQGQVHPDYLWMVSDCRDPVPTREPQKKPPSKKPL